MRFSANLKSIERANILKDDEVLSRGDRSVAVFEINVDGGIGELRIPLPRGVQVSDPEIGRIVREHCYAAFQEIVRQTASWAPKRPDA